MIQFLSTKQFQFLLAGSIVLSRVCSEKLVGIVL